MWLPASAAGGWGAPMPEVRSENEQLVDAILILYTVKRAQSRKCIWGKKEFLKNIFLAEKNMVESQIKGFNFDFYKHDHGPYSIHAQNTIQDLNKNGFLQLQPARLTPSGEEIIHRMNDVFTSNPDIIDRINRVVDERCKQHIDELLEDVYEIIVEYNGQMVKIRDLPDWASILEKISSDEAVMEFNVTEDVIASLEILLDIELSTGLENAVEMAREGGSKPFDALNT